MSELPILEPLAVRPEELKKDKELWQPTWHCFCCQDTGKVQTSLVRLVIPNYDSNRDRFPICQNCNHGHDWIHLEGNYDSRLTPDICSKLDAIAREDWRQTTAAQFAKIKQRIEEQSQVLADTKSLRTRARTGEESLLAHQKHQEALAAADKSAESSEDDLLLR